MSFSDQNLSVISSPEPKAQVSFSDQNLSIVRRRCRHPRCHKLFTFSSSSRTTGPISTKLGTKHSWVKEIQVSSNEGTPLLSKGR